MPESQIEVGLKVWVKNDRHIVETEIASVGRKYITTKWNPRVKFYRDTLRESNYAGEQRFIILSIKAYYNEKYCNELARKFIRFDWNKLNKEELDKVLDVVRDKLGV